MSSQEIQTVEEIITAVKESIQTAVNALDDAEIEVNQVDFEINVVSKNDGSGSVEFTQWVPVKIGTDYSDACTTTILLSVTPEKSSVELMSEAIGRELGQALLLLLKSIDHASSSQPPYDFKSAKISIKIGVEESGGIKVLGFGTESSDLASHQVTLHLCPIQDLN